MFQLHPRLAADTVPVCDMGTSTVLLMKDKRFPWVILVPKREDMTELHQLGDTDFAAVTSEIRAVSKNMAVHFKAGKMNVAALGNMVPQLHIHVIARFKTDPAWPAPVWGAGEAEDYSPSELDSRLNELRKILTKG